MKMKFLNEIEKCFDEAAQRNFMVDSVHNGSEIHYSIVSLYAESFWDTFDLIIDIKTRKARIETSLSQHKFKHDNYTLKNALNQLNRFILNADMVDEDIYSEFQ